MSVHKTKRAVKMIIDDDIVKERESRWLKLKWVTKSLHPLIWIGLIWADLLDMNRLSKKFQDREDMEAIISEVIEHNWQIKEGREGHVLLLQKQKQKQSSLFLGHLRSDHAWLEILFSMQCIDVLLTRDKMMNWWLLLTFIGDVIM